VRCLPPVPRILQMSARRPMQLIRKLSTSTHLFIWCKGSATRGAGFPAPLQYLPRFMEYGDHGYLPPQVPQLICAASYPFKRMSLDARPWVSERNEVV